DGLSDGEAMLYFRPQDIELVDGCGGCIAGTVFASRRVAATRRLELEVGGARSRVEIEVPAEHQAVSKSRIAFRPRRWKVFPTGNRASGQPAAPKKEVRRLALVGT